MRRERTLHETVQRFMASALLCATAFGAIVTAIAGLWPVAAVFAVMAVLFLVLVVYGITASQDDR